MRCISVRADRAWRRFITQIAIAFIPSRATLSQQGIARERSESVQDALTAAIKWATNHLINKIPSYTFRHAWYRQALGWYIGPDASIFMGQRVWMRHARRNGRRVSIGANTVIEHGCQLSTVGGLVIGENAHISPGVWLVTQRFDVDDPLSANGYAPIVIDDYAWIGPRAIITGGVTIGTGAVVKAGALVTQNVEPNSIVSGVLARVIGKREARMASKPRRYRPLFE
jgi:acetyltransferase-like isoleucine patch superfamily enzyme